MTKKINTKIGAVIGILLMIITGTHSVFAQAEEITVEGVVIESSTGEPLKQVIISVAETGLVTDTDADGWYKIVVPGSHSNLTFYMPGYARRQINVNGRTKLNVTLVADEYTTFDKSYHNVFGEDILKNEVYAAEPINADQLAYTKTASFDEALQGIAPGLQVIRQSGLPGQKSFMSIRGNNTLVGRGEPLLIIDGMIHDYNYAHYSVIEGFNLNPLDIVDVDDIANLTILKGGDSHLGGAASNGIIYLNTEQKSEASTLIKITGYGGVSFTPKKLDVMNADQFTNYFKGVLGTQGYSQNDQESMYPWLTGSGDEKYKYDNNTNWQKEIYKPGILQKYHIFLKGGDDIATYNISAGFLNQDGGFDETGYNRFNLRVNGRINITNKFSVTPNVKLSLADSYTPNHGPTDEWNPVTSALLKPALMAPNARDKSTGESLPYLDDDGVFGVSNPVALISNAVGQNRNYHFLSSIKAQYKFNEHLSVATIIGINFNNARENIFLPNIGVVQIDSASNSPKEMVYEFRSTQNHTTLTYKNRTANGGNIALNAGFRYMANSYKHNIVVDLNTPSDDFKNLGQGSKYNYLRQSLGDNRNLVWTSYFASGSYSLYNKYFFNANLSVDANSALNEKNRYNFFPSIGAAWRLSSEEFLADNANIEDLKLRASVSMTGNMYSSVYDYSKLYYNEARLNTSGVLTRESIPNENLDIEKTTTLNLGVDYSGKRQLTNIHADLYYALTHNMIIEQELPPGYGYTEFFDNGGSLSNIGLEIGANHRKNFGDLILIVGGTVTAQTSMVNNLNFVDDDKTDIVTTMPGADYITKSGGVLNAFYGYETDGIFKSDDEAKQYLGPNGNTMKAGDIKYVDRNNDKIINNKDKTSIGNPNPIAFGGLYATASYKKWEFRAQLNYSVANKVFNYMKYKAESMDSYASQFTSAVDYWSKDNTGTDMPRISVGDPTGNTVFSDRWIEDGSYLKLKSLTVAYNLPASKFYSGIKVYLTASNLFTLSGYSGYDPEFYYMNDPFYMGIDYGKMPHLRSFIVGVKLDL